ncbi:MAG: phosphogluconate dehydrogenase (NADP(+)-dependent, decarboxylating) [Deltaproteobacteria bacterium]|nr:MAG: phosphogluconate dehydrogenase (NADP(+)-dependent, decarboxylating) [Deltaproteobacteria bacterium]
MQGQIGVAGLAVMGENLVLNMADKGFRVSVYNRTTATTDSFLAGRAKEKTIYGYHEVAAFVASLERPRKVMLMIKAGEAVDLFIEQLLPHLDPGDIVIDGGNSHYKDTVRRGAGLQEKNILYIGTGVSGGEEGALNGPSIMPGGARDAWPAVQPIFQAISAKAGNNEPCCEWMGVGGAGHYVKMVHNGIEYGDMQLICEAYQLMKFGLGMDTASMQRVFSAWNNGELGSYLIEITADILAYRDESGTPLVESILDAAGQKGTGKWTVNAALDGGVPLSLISESVFARCLSSFKDLRVEASTRLAGPGAAPVTDQETLLSRLQNALYTAKIISYTQGFALMHEASEEYDWGLDYGSIAAIWRGGCIIRSIFLDKITEAYQRDSALENLLFDSFFNEKVNRGQADLRVIVALAATTGIPVPCFSAALAYYDGLRSERLPANLLQAQRDYFGAHTYERIDKPRGTFFHTNWTGRGGETTSSTYSR